MEAYSSEPLTGANIFTSHMWNGEEYRMLASMRSCVSVLDKVANRIVDRQQSQKHCIARESNATDQIENLIL